MQVKMYPAQVVRDNVATAHNRCSSAFLEVLPGRYLSGHTLADAGLLVSAAALLLILLYKRRSGAAVAALQDSHVAVWQQVLLLKQRVDEFDRSHPADDGRDFAYSMAPEAAHE